MMPNLIGKTIKITFFYEAYDINYKHNVLNSVSYNWNCIGQLDDYINSIIETLSSLHKEVIQYSVHEYTDHLIKCVSINKGVEINEI